MIDAPLNVVYVGDDPEPGRNMDQFLAPVANHGLRLVQFHRLDQALEYCEKNSAQAVLLDLDHADFHRDISLNALPDLFPNLPIVAIIGSVLDESDMAAIGRVTQDYLPRDQLDGQDVARIIRQAVRRKASQSRMQQTREALEQWVEQRTHELRQANRALLKEIEERKRAQNELAESRLMLGMITDNIPALLAFVDKDRHYLFANKYYETVMARPVQDIIGHHVSEVLGEAYERNAKKHIEKALSGIQTEYEGQIYVPRDQTPRWHHVTYIPYFSDNREVEGYFVLGSDITERRQTETALRENRTLLQNILDGMGAAVFFIDAGGQVVTEANEIAEELIGLPRREIIGSKWHDLICDASSSGQDKACSYLGGKSLNQEILLSRPDGKLVPVTRSVMPVTIAGHPHHVAILFDITERKALERQLAFAQKLESVGQLAAGIAHEINTPIQYIGNNLQFIRQVYEQLTPILAAYPQLAACREEGRDAQVCAAEALDKGKDVDVAALLQEVPQALQESLEGVERVATIVLAMKKFSHPDVEDWKHVDLNDAIQNTVTITRNEWKHAADIKLELAEDLPLISVIPGDLNQAILNLLVNASHAIAEKEAGTGNKGVITIRTRRLDDQVELTISDTGTGIPEANQSRIFDPFFTTKEPGKGTGQGLAITLTVIKKHEGSIDFESEPGKGTSFIIRLPLEHKNRKD